MFGSVRQAYDLGAAGVGATIYFGSDESTRQMQEVAKAFAEAHQLGLFTVLWCYLRNNDFKKDGTDYHVSADLTGQANHLGVTIEADIIKQKAPENNGGFNAFSGYGKTNKLVYDHADHRQPHRPHPLAGGELLHGPRRAHQQRWRVQGRGRPRRRGAHRGRQQAGRRHGPHLGPQGVPAARCARASSCSRPSRTSTSTPRSPSPDRASARCAGDRPGRHASVRAPVMGRFAREEQGFPLPPRQVNVSLDMHAPCGPSAAGGELTQ